MHDMETGQMNHKVFRVSPLDFSGDNGNPLGAGQGAVACLEKGAS